MTTNPSPSPAARAADLLSRHVEGLLVEVSSRAWVSRMFAGPLMWVLGLLIQRRVKRDLEQLFALLAKIREGGLPLPRPTDMAEKVLEREAPPGRQFAPSSDPKADAFVTAGGGGDGAWDVLEGYRAEARSDHAEEAMLGRCGSALGGSALPSWYACAKAHGSAPGVDGADVDGAREYGAGGNRVGNHGAGDHDLNDPSARENGPDRAVAVPDDPAAETCNSRTRARPADAVRRGATFPITWRPTGRSRTRPLAASHAVTGPVFVMTSFSKPRAERDFCMPYLLQYRYVH